MGEAYDSSPARRALEIAGVANKSKGRSKPQRTPPPPHLTQNRILKESQRKIYLPATSGGFGEKNAIETHP